MGEEALLELLTDAVFHARYRVVRRIKSGGMGAVYEVVDAHLDRRRALKLMLPEMIADRDMRARFELEAKATAKVHSEHVVETIDAGVDAETGAPFLVMELLEGEDLEAVLRRRGALPASEVVTLLLQAASGLDRVHAADIVHRDLKPGNLFLTKRDDGSPRIKVLDFGIAKMVSDASHQAVTTRAMGTPAYMSPEQIRGDGGIGPQADLYSLGHIAYALLTGKPYWWREESSGGMWSIANKAMQGLPEPASVRSAALGVTLPAAFDPWFAQATAVEPEDRFETASAQVEALAAALGEGSRAPVPEVGSASAVHEGSSVPVDEGGISAKAHRNDPRRPEPGRRWMAFVAGGLLLGGLTAGLARRAGSHGQESAASPAQPVAPPAAVGSTETPTPSIAPAASVAPASSSASAPEDRGFPPPTAASSAASAGAPSGRADGLPGHPRSPLPPKATPHPASTGPAPTAPPPPHVPQPTYDPADRP